MPDFLASLIRSIVPIIAGYVLAKLAGLGIEVEPDFEVQLSSALTAILSVLYFVAVRLFETYISPKLGWLLGYAKAPVYAAG